MFCQSHAQAFSLHYLDIFYSVNPSVLFICNIFCLLNFYKTAKFWEHYFQLVTVFDLDCKQYLSSPADFCSAHSLF